MIALNELFARLDGGFGALARFAADASHELRTPLAVIATELEVALRHPRPLEECKRRPAPASTKCDGCRRSSRDCLRWRGRVPSRTTVQLVTCVDAVVAQLSATAEHAGVSLLGPVDEVAARVDGNPLMLETAIRNLVANAIAAVPRGGRVRVSLETISADLVVAVDDDGPGLGANAEALFEPFRRGTAPADGIRGAGLGLAIARRVAIAHGGRLDPGTSQLGGARFALSVPRTDQP